MHKFEGQETNIKKLCRRENNTNLKKTAVEFVSVFSLSGSTPGHVRWYPSLSLGSLLETTRDLQLMADSFSR